MNWLDRSKYTAVLPAARSELGADLADDPLAQHLALQIEAAELALQHRVEWLIEKREDERRAELDDPIGGGSLASMAPTVPRAAPRPARAGGVVCALCGAPRGTPHSTVCPALAG